MADQAHVKQKEDVTEGINPVVEEDLLKTLGRLTNELDVAFDYVNDDTIGAIRGYVSGLADTERMKTFVEETVGVLRKYETNITTIAVSKRKVRGAEFAFMNDVQLFGGLLDFSVFANENKNTRASLVKYLYNIYMSVSILNFGISSGEDIDEFTKQLMTFVQTLRTSSEPVQSSRKVQGTQIPKTQGPQIPKAQVPQVPQAPDGFGNLLQSLMNNGEIMSLATDLSKDIQTQNIDPMTLLSSIMTGKADDRVQNLVSNITNRIETKINSGEIDKGLLEQQAQSIIQSVQGAQGMTGQAMTGGFLFGDLD